MPDTSAPHSPTWLIEPAQRTDQDDLVALMGILFEQESEFTPNPAAQVRGLTRILDNPNVGLILVARLNQQVVGMVNLLFTVSTALGERVALLEDVVVRPHCRGQGLGGALVEAAIAHAKRLGCRRLTLLTDGDNASAQRFYERYGFVASAMKPYRLALNP